MKLNCDIIRDLLPLYCDGVCSPASEKAVKEHLDECNICKAVHDDLKKEDNIPVIEEQEKTKANIFKKIRKKILTTRIIAVIITIAITIGAALLAANKLLEYYPVEYYDGLITIREDDNYRQIYYTGKESDYANMHATDAFITVDGEEKKVFCFYVCGNLYTKYLKADKEEQRIFGVGKNFYDENNGYYAIYYYPFETPLFDEDPNYEHDLKKNGILLWQAE